MNTQLLEALCKDFAAIYQCELIQDTIDIAASTKEPLPIWPYKLWICIHFTPLVK